MIVSIVVPVHNEKEVLPEFHRRLHSVLTEGQGGFEVIYVDDGSWDGSDEILKQLPRGRGAVRIITLSRKFGKEAAMTAGLDAAKGEKIVIIDADLQDPPEVIPALLEKMAEGYDCVYATRLRRDGESWFKKASARLFYRLVNVLSPTNIPYDTGDFRVISRPALDALKQLRETNRFMKGLYMWVGFKQGFVQYSRDPRYAGSTKWNYFQLTNFAINGITSFSNIPLRFASIIGFLVALSAFLYGLFVVVKTLILGDPVAGYPSLMTVVLFLGGTQLLALGIIGEYLGRLFDETKLRPLYIVKDDQSFAPADE